MPVAKQIAVLYCGTHGLLKDVELSQVQEFETKFLDAFTESEEYELLRSGVLDDKVTAKIEETAAAVAKALKK